MFKLLISSLFITSALSAAIDGPKEPEGKIVDLPLEPFNPNATEIVDNDDTNRGGRVFGGTAAVDGQFPFINEINSFSSAGAGLCTGSFLTTSWTITADHCMNSDTRSITILYGSASRTASYRMSVGVNAYYKFPPYDARLDVLLLRHERPITLSTRVGLAQLPSVSFENFYYNAYTVIQAGYGAGRNLQYQQLVLNSNAASCVNLGPNEKYGICGYSKTGTSYVEGGDSGSPMFIYENSKPTIVGVTWGIWKPSYIQSATRVSLIIRQISSVVGLPLRA